MTKSETYIHNIRQLNNDGLQQLFAQIQVKDTPDWADGKALEYLILRQFEIEGAEVIYPFSVLGRGEYNEVIEQIDGMVYTDSISCLIECKDQVKKVDFLPLAKMRNQLLRRPAATIGSVFTTSTFTDAAGTLAAYTGQQVILLWEKTEIEYVIQNNCICDSLKKKYRHFNEHCAPDLNTRWL